MSAVVSAYLDLLDNQRESALAALDGITDAQLWQRPVPGEWSIGEILDHNYLLIASMYPVVERMWRFMGSYGHWRRQRPYATAIEDVYRDPKFPQWVPLDAALQHAQAGFVRYIEERTVRNPCKSTPIL